MRTARLFRDEHLMSVLISALDAALLRPLNISPDLVILRRHRIRCAEDRAGGGRYELDIVLGPQESVEVVASTKKKTWLDHGKREYELQSATSWHLNTLILIFKTSLIYLTGSRSFPCMRAIVLGLDKCHMDPSARPRSSSYQTRASA